MRRRIALIAGALALCMAAAGCSTSTQTEPNPAGAATAATSEPAETAATLATAEIAEVAAPEEEISWEEMDDAYLSGIHAEDYVELPEDYKHIKVVAEKPADPTKEEVADRIEVELKNHATAQEVDRKVKEGDTVSIDFAGSMDGIDPENLTGSYDLVIGSDTFIDGFEDGLIGAKKGETRELNLTFPENYREQTLAGKDVVFTVTVNKVSETVVPELKDDYVKSLNLTNDFGQAITEVEDYEDYIRSNLIEERESSYENTVLSAVISELISKSTFKQDPPENLLEKYNYLETRKLEYRALLNYMDLASYMKAVYGATDENYQEMIRDMAEYYTRQELVLQAIADKRDLNVSEEEMQKVIAEYVASDSSITSADELKRLVKEALRDDLMTQNVLDWLYDHCKVEEPAEEEENADTSEEASEGTTAEETAAADASSENASGDLTAAEASAETSGDEEKDSAQEEKDKEDKEDKDKEEKDKEEKDGDDKEEDTAARHDN